MLAARAIAAVALAAALSAGGPPPRCTGIVGYNDMAAMIGAAVDRVRARHPELCYAVRLPSTRAGPPALIDGSADLAPMGAAMTMADRAAVRTRWGAEPIEFSIAHDSLTPGALSSPTGALLAVANPLGHLSMAALRRVFTQAEAPVWGDLGATGDWAARPVHPVTLAADTAIGSFLLSGPFRANHWPARVMTTRQSRDVAAAVAADPFALGLANLNVAVGGVRAASLVDDRGRLASPDAATVRDGGWPMDRHLLVYARPGGAGGMTPGARALIAFLLSDEGQSIVARAPLRYLPLNRRERAVERKKLGP